MRLLLSLWVVLFAVPCLAEPLRILVGPRIDFLRPTEAGEIHLALRCSTGVGADNLTKCQIQKRLGAGKPVRYDIAEDEARTLLETFYARIPAADLMPTAGSLRKMPYSYLQYHVTFDGKHTQGALTHDPAQRKPGSEATTRAVLSLEEYLENHLIFARLKAIR